MGTSPLAILVGLVIVPLLILFQKLFKQGWRGLWKHIIENVKSTTVYTAFYTAVIWSLFIGYNFFFTVPGNIRTQADRVPSPMIGYPKPPAWAHKFERKSVLAAPRSHIHVTAVDLVSASPGEVIRTRVHFRNNGNAEITHCLNYMVIAVGPFFKDIKAQTENENFLFDGAKEFTKKSPIAPNQIPAHSISVNSDNSGIKPLTIDLLSKVGKGEYAIYLMGRIMYRDSDKLHHADYCYLTKGDVNGMKLCFVHNH